jgi:preprotein translocase subunit Sec63
VTSVAALVLAVFVAIAATTPSIAAYDPYHILGIGSGATISEIKCVRGLI